MLEDPTTVDFITKSDDGKISLIITDSGMTTNEEERLKFLKANLFNYLNFIVSEDFAAEYPGVRPSDVAITVICATKPTPQMTELTYVALGDDKENAVAVEFIMGPPLSGTPNQQNSTANTTADTPHEKEANPIVVIGMLGLICALGVFMFLNPDAGEEADPSGRQALLKTIVAWLWGRPAGVILALLGGLGAISTIKDVIKGKPLTPSE